MKIENRIAKLHSNLTAIGKIPDALFIGRKEISELHKHINDFLIFNHIYLSEEIQTFMGLTIIPIDSPTFFALGTFFTDDEIST